MKAVVDDGANHEEVFVGFFRDRDVDGPPPSRAEAILYSAAVPDREHLTEICRL